MLPSMAFFGWIQRAHKRFTKEIDSKLCRFGRSMPLCSTRYVPSNRYSPSTLPLSHSIFPFSFIIRTNWIGGREQNTHTKTMFQNSKMMMKHRTNKQTNSHNWQQFLFEQSEFQTTIKPNLRFDYVKKIVIQLNFYLINHKL